ncbi:MAG: amino acid ABC transporter substrate-binding protein [Deltaproteobacteria bacterium]|nr:amino acid ABC transporter substrate-binding protein [Deltaproteobacteria bacterium]
MRSLSKIIIVISFVFLFTGLAGAETIKLTSGEWPPYMSKKMKHFGFASHVVEKSFANEGVKVKWAFYPWNRSLVLAKKGLWDGSVVWGKTKERQKDFYYSKAKVLYLKDVFFHRKDFKFKWKTFKDLKKFKIGATLGYSYGDAFLKAEKSGLLKTQRVKNDVLNFRKLLKGRIDIFILTQDVGYSILKKEFKADEVSQITHNSKSFRSRPYFLILSKNSTKSKKFMSLFDKGYKKIVKSGELKKMEEDLISGKYEK